MAKLVGGVGVAGGSAAVNEFAAFSGVAGAGFAPHPAAPGVVIVGGIALPFVDQTTRPTGVNPGTNNGAFTMGRWPARGLYLMATHCNTVRTARWTYRS